MRTPFRHVRLRPGGPCRRNYVAYESKLPLKKPLITVELKKKKIFVNSDTVWKTDKQGFVK